MVQTLQSVPSSLFHMNKVLTNARAARNLLALHKPVLVYDVETTGLSAKTDHIIQFSGILKTWDGTQYVTRTEMNQYIRPKYHIPAVITEITGISDETLKEAPYEEECFQKIIEFLCQGKIFVGYNNSFDDKMISACAKRNIGKNFTPAKRIDVYRIAQELIESSDLTDSSYKLCNVADYYKVTTDGFHNSMVDIVNTWDVLMAEMQDLELQDTDMPQTAEYQITGASRWKKSFSKTQRYDRIYVTTDIGEIVFDLIKNTVFLKKEPSKVLNSEELIQKLNDFLSAHGYSSYAVFDGYIK